ncbi:MAG: hypothetical protein QUU85_07605 [Candidatus Eisenbacteria bacterium]|nr:hypothetical protein [Candidatus Eisenbacteria bacterium]
MSFDVKGRSGAARGRAEVGLYDISGRLVTTLARDELAIGRQSLRWNGLDRRGDPVRAGVYFLRWTCGGEVARLKVTVAH